MYSVHSKFWNVAIVIAHNSVLKYECEWHCARTNAHKAIECSFCIYICQHKKKWIQNDKIMKMTQIKSYNTNIWNKNNAATTTTKNLMELNTAKESVEHIALNRVLEVSDMQHPQLINKANASEWANAGFCSTLKPDNRKSTIQRVSFWISQNNTNKYWQRAQNENEKPTTTAEWTYCILRFFIYIVFLLLLADECFLFSFFLLLWCALHSNNFCWI